jgi:hypothetical protein
MFLFKLAVFFILSGRFAGTNSSPEAYSLPKKLTSTLRVKLVFYFEHHLSLKTTKKSKKTFQTITFKMCCRKLSVTLLANVIQKKSVKLFGIVKMYVCGANEHALVRGLQNRTRQTSVRGRK